MITAHTTIIAMVIQDTVCPVTITVVTTGKTGLNTASMLNSTVILPLELTVSLQSFEGIAHRSRFVNVISLQLDMITAVGTPSKIKVCDILQLLCWSCRMSG